MAGIGKGHEMDFGSKRVDVRRFAYDVVKYSALKFGVPENCIDIYEGSDNDYGCPDFCSALFRIVVEYQLVMRYDFHLGFERHYQLNKLKSFKCFKKLFQDIVNKKGLSLKKSIHVVEFYLSFACELVLFFYSKKLNLHLQKLAKWFDELLRPVREPFEKEGGIMVLYLKGSDSEHCIAGDFFDKFISVYCLPYEVTAKDRNLMDFALMLHDRYWRKLAEYFLQVHWRKLDDIFVRETSGEGGFTKYEIVMLPVASGSDRPDDSVIETIIKYHPEKFIKFLRTDEGASFIAKTISHLFNKENLQDQTEFYSSICSEEKGNPLNNIYRRLISDGFRQLILGKALDS